MGEVKLGDRVNIHYTGQLEDGTVFDSSQDRDPLEFVAGEDEVIAGVSNAVLGMKPGESKNVELEPEEGYGARQEGLEQRVERTMLPDEAKVGDPLQATVGDHNIVVWVMEISDNHAVLDANHPLAGHRLLFDIELVSVNPGESKPPKP